jgi:acetyl-CoA carboxylase alpha subunit
MSNLKVPVVAVITGEGGSGGALGLAVANSVLMMEHAVYSVISPEGCAAILWRTRDKAAEASQALKITAPQLLEEGLIDDIIPEAQGGAHNDPDSTAANLGQAILGELRKYTAMSAEEITAHRKSKFRHYGVFEDIGSGVT